MTLVDLCRQFVAVESTPTHGNRDAVNWVAELARERGLICEIEESHLDGIPQANVLIRPPHAEASAEEFHFVSHLGTRDPGDYSAWTKTGANPFHLSTDGEWAYGLGVAEGKADFLCKLEALSRYSKEKKFRRIPVVVGTFGMEDAAGAIRIARRYKNKIQFALVSAPTGMRMADRGPGFARVEILVPFTQEEIEFRRAHDLAEGSVTQTKVFHASSRQKWSDRFSDNPILKSLDYLEKLPRGISLMSLEGGSSPTTHPDLAVVEVDLVDGTLHSIVEKLIRINESVRRFNIEIKSLRDENFDPPHSTIGVGMVRTHASHVTLAGYCRLLPVDSSRSQDRQVYETWLEKLRSDCAAAGAELKILDYKPPFLSSPNRTIFEEFKSVCFDFGIDQKWVAAPACTEANVFSRLDIPSIVFGPSEVSLDTPANEKAGLRDLDKAAEFYSSVIKRMCI